MGGRSVGGMKRAYLLLAVALTGCVSAKVFPSGSGRLYRSTVPSSVLVFFAAEDVGRPYEVIGQIMTEGSSGWGRKDSDLVKRAVKEAASIGAHAIIVSKQKGSSGLTAAIFGTADKVHEVQAIRFTAAAEPIERQ